MTNFNESYLSTHALNLWNSDFWVILVNFWSRWLRTGHTTSNRRRFNVHITSICWKENMDKLPRHFDVLFRCNFDGRKIDVVSTYSLRCNFDERKIDVVSMYFVRRNFDERNIDVVSMFFFFFRLDFDGRKINIVSVYFGVQFKWKTDVTAHILMLFWKTKNCGRFDISFS